MTDNRFFEVTITDKWIENKLDYQTGENHQDIANKLPLKSKRIYNERFREIEKTGRYYRITENKKGGKSFIFEIIDTPAASLAEKHNIPVSEAKEALKIETEHRDTLEQVASGKITVDEAIEKTVDDHLKESKDYYDKEKGLPAMEEKLKKEGDKPATLNKTLIRELDIRGEKVKVYTVNANYVNVTYKNNFPDAKEWHSGGHNKGWNTGMEFIPVGEIWLDEDANPVALNSFLLHEAVEYLYMFHEGMDYDTAHDRAVKIETEYKELALKSDDPDKLLEQYLDKYLKQAEQTPESMEKEAWQMTLKEFIDYHINKQFVEKPKIAKEEGYIYFFEIKRNLPEGRFTYETYDINGNLLSDGINARNKLYNRKDKYYKAGTGTFTFENGEKFTIDNLKQKAIENHKIIHKEIVNNEIKFPMKEGNIVPAEVLADYPELTEQKQNKEPEPENNIFENEVMSLYNKKHVKTPLLEVKNILSKKTATQEDKELLYNYEGEGSVKGGETKTGILHEFFTPDWLCFAMADILRSIGAKFDKVLDPAIGTGRLEKYIDFKELTAFEVNATNYAITHKLYPKAKLHNLPFETAFLQEPRFTSKAKKSWIGNDFDLIISNPPYGEYSGEYKIYMPKIFTRFEFLFVSLSMDLLKSGGYGIFVLPQSFMNNGNLYNKQKEEIMKKSIFVDAVRLPNAIFASTDIGVDILILKKK